MNKKEQIRRCKGKIINTRIINKGILLRKNHRKLRKELEEKEK